jgi:deoxyribonuclease V
MLIRELEKEQRELAKRLIIRDDFESLKIVAGGDLTFLDIWKNPTVGLAAFVLVDIESGKIVEEVVIDGIVDFPYIPTFLAYRELPLLIKAFENLKTKADIYLIDGQGIAHPRRMGIASHFGVVLNVPSIGVAKSLLYGRYSEPNPKGYTPLYSRDSDEQLGWVIRRGYGKDLLFISPGHRVSIETSLRIVINFLRNGWEIPTFLAHKVLQRERRKRIKQP